jgi:hypothetical protein
MDDACQWCHEGTTKKNSSSKETLLHSLNLTSFVSFRFVSFRFVSFPFLSFSFLFFSPLSFPFRAEDIGTWQTVFEALSAISIVSNMGIIFAVSEEYKNTPWMTRIVLFLCYEHGIFMLQFLFAVIIDDVPQSTSIQVRCLIGWLVR